MYVSNESSRSNKCSMTVCVCQVLYDCSELQCVAVCSSVLQCVTVRCSVLQCVAVFRFMTVPRNQSTLPKMYYVNTKVLRCAAVCCRVLQCIAVHRFTTLTYNTRTLP